MKEQKKWYVVAWDTFCWLIVEVIKTGSNEPSFFASKRLERFAMFSVAMGIIIGFVKRKWEVLGTEDVLMITGMLFAGGAWNAIQIRKDIKETQTTPTKDDTSKEP